MWCRSISSALVELEVFEDLAQRESHFAWSSLIANFL